MQAESAGVGGDRQGAREQLDAWGAASRNSFRPSLLIKIFWLCVKFSRISTECRLHLPEASPPEHAFWNQPSRSSIEAAAWSDTHTLCKALLLDLHMIKKKEKQWKQKPRLVFAGAVVLVLHGQPSVPGPASLSVLSECLGDGTETVWAGRQCRLCLLQPVRRRPHPESPPGLPQSSGASLIYCLHYSSSYTASLISYSVAEPIYHTLVPFEKSLLTTLGLYLLSLPKLKYLSFILLNSSTRPASIFRILKFFHGHKVHQLKAILSVTVESLKPEI